MLYGDNAVPLVWTLHDDVVIAIADPWVYNEYIGHTLLPQNYDNATPAENIIIRLLGPEPTARRRRR